MKIERSGYEMPVVSSFEPKSMVSRSSQKPISIKSKLAMISSGERSLQKTCFSTMVEGAMKSSTFNAL